MRQNPGRLLGCAGGLILALLVLAGVFWIGLRVGEAQARLFGNSAPWPEHRFERVPWAQDFLTSHGALGEIQSVEPGAIVIQGRSGIKRRILVEQGTIIGRGRQRIAVTDLQVGERIIAFGSPHDNGDLGARVIRVWVRKP